MSTGLIMEGGGMRGLFTAGVMDVLLENQVQFDSAVGVSAGAIFGSNIKSGQIGRVYRFNMRFCQDSRYLSLRSLLKTGDIFGADFCYNQLTYHLDPFDYEAFEKNPMKFYAVCTHLKTGKPVYHLCPKGTPDDMIWIRASASMPLVSRTVMIDGEPYLDGGVADPLPIRFAQSLGHDKYVIIRTKAKDYRKKPQKGVLAAKLRYKDYPNFVDTFSKRHEIYNNSVAFIEELKRQGKVFVLEPETTPEATVIEKNPRKLRSAYDEGRRITQAKIKELQVYLSDNTKLI